MPSFAQLTDEEMLDYNTLVAKEQLRPITGRIIKVITTPKSVKFTNVCSGILSGDNTIITAAHCFKVKPIFAGWDKVTKRLKQIVSRERFYFDIPGVTSHNFYEEALKIAGINKTTGEINMEISRSQGRKLNELLKSLPEITRARYPREYYLNMPTYIASEFSIEDYEKYMELRRKYPINYDGFVHDFAIAELDRAVGGQRIPISEAKGTTAYAAGFFGGSLETPLQVFKCDTGTHILKELEMIADTDALNRVKLHKDHLLFTNCDGELLSGISGGPQVILNNGQIHLVGLVSGQLFGTHKYGISPILIDVVMIPFARFLGFIPD